MGKYKVDGTPYRTPATPDCSCDRCQVSPWRLSFAWMFWRIVVASLLAIGLIVAATWGIGYVSSTSKTSVPCHEEACRDYVNIVGKGSTPYRCPYVQQQMTIVELHDNEVEVRCLCTAHDSGTPPASVP
jgi:hypothetical protein